MTESGKRGRPRAAVGHGEVGGEPEVAAIERELRRLLRHVRRYSTDLARTVHPDLDPAVYSLLVDIVESSPARAADLSDERGVTKGVISRQVRSLERLGLVQRERDLSDARAQTLVPTALGRRSVRRSQAARRESLERLLQHSTPDELATMAAALTRFNDLID